MAYDYVPYDGPIVDRDEAIRLGLKRYFTGNPCRKGHISQRTLNGGCFTCAAINSRLWYENNKERAAATAARSYEKRKPRLKAYNKNYQEVNKEAISKRAREYRLKNLEKIREKARQRYRLNRKERIAAVKLYTEKNKEKVSAAQRSLRHKRRNAEGSFSSSDVFALGKLQKWKCANCKTCIKDSYHVDHIMPLSRGGSNWPNNLQLLCPPCNQGKHAKHPIEWAQENGRLL